jgi:hypothetical protein
VNDAARQTAGSFQTGTALTHASARAALAAGLERRDRREAAALRRTCCPN